MLLTWLSPDHVWKPRSGTCAGSNGNFKDSPCCWEGSDGCILRADVLNYTELKTKWRMGMHAGHPAGSGAGGGAAEDGGGGDRAQPGNAAAGADGPLALGVRAGAVGSCAAAGEACVGQRSTLTHLLCRPLLSTARSAKILPSIVVFHAQRRLSSVF